MQGRKMKAKVGEKDKIRRRSPILYTWSYKMSQDLLDI